MLLSQGRIRQLISAREITINPFEASRLGKVSYDLTISDKVINPETGEVIELTDFQLMPGQFMLANTKEYIILSDKVAALVMNRSSLSRLGVLTTCDAHLVEPGFEGSLTLALKNVSNKPVLLRQGLALVHLVFMEIDGVIEANGDKSQSSRYAGSQSAILSKLCREIQDES